MQMVNTPQPAWHSKSVQDVIDDLKTHLEQGLSSDDAAQRLHQHGNNELREKPPTPFWKLVVEQLSDFVVILLIAASVISFLLGDTIEAVAIIAIVILNAVIGVIQDARAEQALAALKKMAAPDAQVIRDGSRVRIPSRELVPGDIVLLEAGNFIPADVRLVESVNLKIEEAALTGESVPVEKRAALTLEDNAPIGDRKNTAFMGTVVSYGRGTGVVVGTGHLTQIGLIADMLAAVEEEATPLQRRLEELGKTLSIAALIVCGLVFVVAIFKQTDLSLISSKGFVEYFTHSTKELSEIFIIAISLAIAAVPEGLPAVVTITLALGMREMVKRHALIRRLASVETLGSASVICSDKTGTLTQNEMTAVKLWCDDQHFDITGDGYKPQGQFLHENDHLNFSDHPALTTLLWGAMLANDARLEKSGSERGEDTYRMVGDPTEGALVVAAAKANIWRKEVEKSFPRVAENPFDSARKIMSTLHEVKEAMSEVSPLNDPKDLPNYVLCAKGAPDVILDACASYQRIGDETAPITPEFKDKVLRANADLSSQALRVLAVGYRLFNSHPEPMTPESTEKDLVFVGLIGMIDPARPEVKPAIEKARHAGIRTVMITGDYPDTARAIAYSIGLLRPGAKVLAGATLDELNDQQMVEVARETDVFARVSPSHKMKIVDAMKQTGAVVAMTGDGVNDAPALKRSDIGVAMGITGTDVAKESADMVLTDDNFASIVAAVEQGRIIYNNIRKFVFFLLSSNVAEIAIIFLATLAGVPVPLTAIQLLWLNLVTDGAPALALAVEKGDPDVMDRPPRPKEEPVINRSMQLGILIQTFAQTGGTLLALALGLYWSLVQANLVPAGINPVLTVLQFNWSALNADQIELLERTGQTMAFLTLSFSELFRAYTVRSERMSVFQIGVFSNKYMQYAVGSSIILLLLVTNVPFLQPIFNTHFLTLEQWLTVFGLALIPAIAEEITKAYLRTQKA
ncbi:MAG: cation-translocating P-type ATPase [Chloroflexi bacterium]|nr:cation-translocating P-type ATPase [Chloroflexota bacterium]MBI5349259.1 cation-translocating P-type ATPase [Chloroflexota bacterium]